MVWSLWPGGVIKGELTAGGGGGRRLPPVYWSGGGHVPPDATQLFSIEFKFEFAQLNSITK